MRRNKHIEGQDLMLRKQNLGHLLKGCLFVGALGEAVSAEVSRS